MSRSDRGKMTRLFKLVCFDCADEIVVEKATTKAAAAEARQTHDWSLGRDKRWRCESCRPARFGESR